MEILNRKTLNHPPDSLSRTAMILRGSRVLLSLPPSSHHRSCEWCGPFVVCKHRRFPCSCPCAYNGAFPATANLMMLGSLAVYTSFSNGNQPIPDWITCCYSNRFTGHIELNHHCSGYHMLPSVCISTPPFYSHRYSLAVLMSSVQQMLHPVKSPVSPAATTLKLHYTSRNSMKAERTSEVSITRYYVINLNGSASDHRPSTVHSELHVNFSLRAARRVVSVTRTVKPG